MLFVCYLVGRETLLHWAAEQQDLRLFILLQCSGLEFKHI